MKKAALLTLIILLFGLVYWGCEDCQTCPENHAPVINEILANPSTVSAGGLSYLTAVATDKDGDTITYHWSFSGGYYPGISGYGVTTNPTLWRSPDTAGTYTITCIVSDGKDTDSKSISITVT